MPGKNGQSAHDLFLHVDNEFFWLPSSLHDALVKEH